MTNWTADWQEVIDAVGRDFSDGDVRYGVDRIERSTLRRYLEPLEFDCQLHSDSEFAAAHGYPDIIAPFTAALTWTIPATWSPGETPIFIDEDRDSQPARSPINNQGFELGPRTTGFFATDIELDFIRPVVIGELIGRRGNKLVSCTPKETAVGRGAFMVWESEIVDEAGEVVTRLRVGTYAYVPNSDSEKEKSA